MSKVTLTDGEVRHKRYPTSFKIPHQRTRTTLRPWDHAKLVFEQGGCGERMWVRVTSTKDGQYRGVLVDDPVRLDIRRGRRVTFEPRHIIAALTVLRRDIEVSKEGA